MLLSGTIYTARDKAHRKLTDFITSGEKLPLELKNSAIYYCGPVIDKESGLFSSAGPTTSSRMDEMTEPLLTAGVAVLIGKGPRSEHVIASIAKHRAIYFSTIGGAGVYLADRIKHAQVMAFPELLSEAIYELTIEEFPCYVAVDSHGKSIYSR